MQSCGGFGMSTIKYWIVNLLMGCPFLFRGKFIHYRPLTKKTTLMSFPSQENNQASFAALSNEAALSQKDFSSVVHAFVTYPDQDQFLLQANAHNEKLAETLLVFRKRLTEASAQDSDPAPLIDQAFLHYIVNTDGPIIESEGSDPFDVFDAATRYARSLNVGVSKDAKGKSILHVDGKEVPCPAWGAVPGQSAAKSLRQVGPVINKVRYGRDDVIPSDAFDFDENAEGHSLENAMILADFAHLAYFKPAYVEKQLKTKTWGYTSFRWVEDEDSDTQVFVAGKGEHLIVCFRGTSSGKDALVDLKFFKTKAFGGRGKVHRGFNGALDSVWVRLKAAVDALGGDKKLFVCGHSLGAALAQLAAHRFALEGYKVSQVYVYGSPRVGNREFRGAYNELLGEQTFLHINNKDIVTQVPLRLLGFHHLGGTPRSFNNGHDISHESSEADTDEEEMEYEMLTPEMQEEIRWKMYDVEQSIRASTRFLTTNPTQLQVGSYETQFEAGAVDEHSMDQYLFKFACAIVDGEWDRIGRSQ